VRKIVLDWNKQEAAITIANSESYKRVTRKIE
jgi:hypothetical protein